VIPPANPEIPLSLCSMYCQELYACPALETFGSTGEFFNTTEIDPLEQIDPVKYYTRVGIRSDQSLSVPANLHVLLDRFLSICDDDQERFIRACFWFNHAHAVSLDSMSASFMALISALEALMPAEHKAGDCPVCKRSFGKGATRRLSEFLDEYAPTEPKFQASRVALYYEFRSQLAHGGRLSDLDRGTFVWSLGGRPREERELHDEVRQLVRIILVNWLHSRRALLIPTQGRGRGLFAFGW
jgi:Apea-like HEPN